MVSSNVSGVRPRRIPSRPLFAVGDRVCSRIPTCDGDGAGWHGRFGTVVRVERRRGALDGPRWDVAVAWDGAPTGLLAHHDAAELTRACEL